MKIRLKKRKIIEKKSGIKIKEKNNKKNPLKEEEEDFI